MLHSTWPTTLTGILSRAVAYRVPSVDDYAGVLVPLDEAHLYSHTARQGLRSAYAMPVAEEEHGADESGDLERGSGYDNDDDGGGDDGPPDGCRASAAAQMLPMRACEYSIEGLRRSVRQREGERAAAGKEWRSWTDYELKSKLINKAIQDIGMGRYNWQLFILCGFGWFADNLWMQGVSLILPSLSAEFGIAEKTVRYTTSALYLGLSLGSFFWGVGSDVLGRRLAFHCTLLLTSLFGTLAAAAPSWGAVCACVAALGFGVGGNLPVDGALFLEFLPDASSSLLTLLSVWWPVGQLCSSVLAWIQIAGGAGGADGADSAGPGGTAASAAGWRRFLATVGLLTFAMFVVRYFVFHLFESPKYLLLRGRQAEAVAVVHGLAHRNGTKTWLTEAILDAVAQDRDSRRSSRSRLVVGDGDTASASRSSTSSTSSNSSNSSNSSTSSSSRHHGYATVPLALGAPSPKTPRLLRDRLAAFSGDRLRPLFQSRQLGTATVLMWGIWATIGMGYPLFNAFLPQYLSHGGSTSAPATTAQLPPAPSVVYRNYAITSVAGVPGSLLAAYTVDSASPFLGRRGTLAASTLVSAVFLFLFVALGRTPGWQLVFSCVEAFAQNIMYGVLYAFTPEIFPAPVRGAGTGVASFFNRVTGLLAPVLAATLPGDGATAPIHLAAVLILLAFFGMVLMPIETRGRQRL